MIQLPVIIIEDITNIVFKELRPGCGKGVLQEDAASQASVFRVRPGSGVPTHRHSHTRDLFLGIKAEIEIHYEDQYSNGVFVLRPGAFCSMPPGVRHAVSNSSKTNEALFLLVHTAYRDFDTVPTPFS
jgi:quercetin dioxygenase-like cupin family protein